MSNSLAIRLVSLTTLLGCLSPQWRLLLVGIYFPSIFRHRYLQILSAKCKWNGADRTRRNDSNFSNNSRDTCGRCQVVKWIQNLEVWIALMFVCLRLNHRIWWTMFSRRCYEGEQLSHAQNRRFRPIYAPSSFLVKLSSWTPSEYLYVSQHTTTGTECCFAIMATRAVPARLYRAPLEWSEWAPIKTLETSLITEPIAGRRR